MATLPVNGMTLIRRNRLELAERVARSADQSQAQADALYALHHLVLTDPRFEVLRDTYTTERLASEADDYADDAETCREQALALGYVPR